MRLRRTDGDSDADADSDSDADDDTDFDPDFDPDFDLDGGKPRQPAEGGGVQSLRRSVGQGTVHVHSEAVHVPVREATAGPRETKAVYAYVNEYDGRHEGHSEAVYVPVHEAKAGPRETKVTYAYVNEYEYEGGSGPSPGRRRRTPRLRRP